MYNKRKIIFAFVIAIVLVAVNYTFVQAELSIEAGVNRAASLPTSSGDDNSGSYGGSYGGNSGSTLSGDDDGGYYGGTASDDGGSSNGPTDPGYDPSRVPSDLRDKTKDVWATVVVLVQIASVACVVFAGLRYMFASADQKADIKQGLIYITIGAMFVFGATSIISLVADAAKDIL